METSRVSVTHGAFLVLGGLFGAALLSRLFLATEYTASSFRLSQLVDPQAVKPIADKLGGSGDEAILAAWRYAGQNINYSYFGSEMHFTDHTVECQGCLLPTQVVSVGQSNCVGKSVLLASLLRNKYPAGDVYVVVGEYVEEKVGGHAWVMLQRNGSWYVLEATRPPPSANPWIPMNQVSDNYIPYVWFNDLGKTCYNNELCTIDVSIGDRPCCRCGECSEA
jgi:hypothetical protein